MHFPANTLRIRKKKKNPNDIREGTKNKETACKTFHFKTKGVLCYFFTALVFSKVRKEATSSYY